MARNDHDLAIDVPLLYVSNPAGSTTAVPITVTGATLEPGAPVVLFPARIANGGVDKQPAA